MKYPYVEKVTWDGVTCDILRPSGQQCGHKVALLQKNQKRDREPFARSTCATLFQGYFDRQGAAPQGCSETHALLLLSLKRFWQ